VVLRRRPTRPFASRMAESTAAILATLGWAARGPVHPQSRVAAYRRLPVDAATGRVGVIGTGPSTGPRVILVHGTPGSAGGWIDYLVEAPPGLEWIAVDRPGFGDSAPRGPVTGLTDQAAAIATLLPDPPRRTVLVGHSLGGPVVAAVAAAHPERVDAIVLLAASLDPSLEVIHPVQHVADHPLIRPLLPRALRNANRELMDLKSELEALAPRLASIRARVVIVHGTGDRLVPVENVAYVTARLPNAAAIETRLLEGRNHFLPWNSRDIVVDAIGAALGHG
jgi:pimeloyl-ACP methyl ester carboxylesterase